MPEQHWVDLRALSQLVRLVSRTLAGRRGPSPGARGSRLACWMLAAGITTALWSGPLFAQGSTATIFGIVEDASGGLLPGVTVSAKHVNTGATRETITDGSGIYRLPGLQVGQYEIRAELAGFKPEIRTGISLTIAQEAGVNFKLEVGALQESITVTGTAALISTTSASLGGLVDEKQLAELPLNGRNYIDLSLMQAGVTQNKAAGGAQSNVWLVVNGAPQRSNNFTVDGAPMNSLTGGAAISAAGTTLGLDGISEYKVITNSFSSEYGQTMGSQVVIVSKSGSNDWHGSLFEYVRNNALDARNRFDAGKQPVFRRNNFGGSFGGPIKVNKMHFWGVYEGLRQDLGFTARDIVLPAACHTANNIVDNSCVPTLAAGQTLTVVPVIRPLLALLPPPNLPNNQFTFDTSGRATVDYGQLRIDHTFSSADSMFVRFTTDSSDVNNPNTALVPTNTGTAFPGVRFGGKTQNHFLSVGENHVFSPTVFNSMRASYSSTDLVSGLDTSEAGVDLSGPQYSMVPGYALGSFGVTGFTTYGGTSSSGPPELHQGHLAYSFGNDLMITKGDHALKVGGLVNALRDKITLPFITAGSVTFGSIQNFLLGLAQSQSAQTRGSNQRHDYSYATFGLYLQDDWRASTNLTFNLGLRYEIMNTPTDALEGDYTYKNLKTDTVATRGVLKNYTAKNFMPRAGFSYDLKGNGRTVIRSAFGVFMDVGNIGQVFWQNSYGTPPNASQSAVASAESNPFTLPFTWPAGSVGSRAYTNQYEASQPTTYQYNVTLGQELPGDIGITVAYVGLRGRNIFTTKEGNPVIPQIVNGQRFWGPEVVACANVKPSCRENPNLASVFYVASESKIWYDSLQMTLLRRFRGGWQAQAAFTWANAIDTTQANGGGNDGGGQSGVRLNPFDESYDKGPTFSTVPRVLNMNLLYEFPRAPLPRVLSGVINGWRMAHKVTMHDGYAFQPISGTQRSRSGNLAGANERVSLGTDTVAPGQTDVNGWVNTTPATFIPYDAKTVLTGDPNQWFNPYMFRLAPLGYNGNSPRNLLRGPGLISWDMSLTRTIKLGASDKRVELRVEIFNVQNRVNFGMPDPTVFPGSLTNGNVMQLPAGITASNPLGNAGRITTTATPARQVQLSARFAF